MRVFDGKTYKVAGYKGGERGQITIKGIRYYKYFKYPKKTMQARCKAWQEKKWLEHSKNDSDSASWLYFRKKWNEWARTQKKPLTERTITEHNQAFERVEKLINPVFLNDITLRNLRLMITDLEDQARKNGHDNYGVNKVITCMRKDLRWAMNKGYMDDIPVDNIEHLEVNEVIVKTNKIHEIELLLKYGNPMERAVVLFGFDCSCRPEEICNMRWDKLDLDGGFGWISPNPDGWKPKCGKSRQIRLTTRLIEELKKLPMVSDYVVTNQYERKYSNGGFSVFYRKFVEKVNRLIKEKESTPIKITSTCKTLRKDYATSRQAMGAEQKSVSQSMGHSKTDVTRQHYTNDQQEELKRLKEEQERQNLLELDKFRVELNY